MPNRKIWNLLTIAAADAGLGVIPEAMARPWPTAGAPNPPCPPQSDHDPTCCDCSRVEKGQTSEASALQGSNVHSFTMTFHSDRAMACRGILGTIRHPQNRPFNSLVSSRDV